MAGHTPHLGSGHWSAEGRVGAAGVLNGRAGMDNWEGLPFDNCILAWGRYHSVHGTAGAAHEVCPTAMPRVTVPGIR